MGVWEHDWLAARIHITEGTLLKHSAAMAATLPAMQGRWTISDRCAPGFTFTPALPPMIAAAALASRWHVRPTPHSGARCLNVQRP